MGIINWGSAKNFEDVLLLTEPEDYDDFVNRWGMIILIMIIGRV